MRLTPKIYALMLIATGFVSFGAIVAANVVIDPQGVFGTTFSPQKSNPNQRYARYLAYRKSETKVTGLFFASSRGVGVPVSELSVGTDVHYADFTVAFGLMTDHLPVLERVLRDKESSGGRLEQVFVLLDIDFLGSAPRTNRSPQTTLHADLTGEHPMRFWIKYLTAIQFGAWKEGLRSAANSNATTVAVGHSPSPAQFNTGTPALASIPQASVVPRPEVEPVPPPSSLTTANPLTRVTARYEYQNQLALLRRFAQLCRDHGAELIVATSPLRRTVASTFDRPDLAAAVADVSRITPVWDFGSPSWLSDRPELWIDQSHFKTEVGRLMLKRILTGATPSEGVPFGELVPP